GLQAALLFQLINSIPVPLLLAIICGEPLMVIVPSTSTTGRFVPTLLATVILEEPPILKLPVIYVLPLTTTLQLLATLTLPVSSKFAGQVRLKGKELQT